MLEQLIQDLIAALNANTAALKGAAVSPAAETKKPRKTKEAEAPVPEPTVSGNLPPVAVEPVKELAPVEIVNPTIEDLRAVGGKLVAAGKGDELKAVLGEYNVAKLSAVPTDKYAEVHAKLTAKLNAK